MLLRPQPFALGPEHQRDARRVLERDVERVGRLAVERDAPVARLGDLVERAGEIDHAHPGHEFQRPGRRPRDYAGFGRGMAVLCDDAKRIERGGRAQDGADIVRIGDLIEHDDRPARGFVALAFLQQIAQPDVVERLDFRDNALVGRVARHHPAQVSHIGIDDGQDGRQLERGNGLARAPDLANHPVRVGERRGDGVAAIKAGESRPWACLCDVLFSWNALFHERH